MISSVTSNTAVVTTAIGTTPTVVPTTRPTVHRPTGRGAGLRRGKQCIWTGWLQLLCSKYHDFLAFFDLALLKTDKIT